MATMESSVKVGIQMNQQLSQLRTTINEVVGSFYSLEAASRNSMNTGSLVAAQMNLQQIETAYSEISNAIEITIEQQEKLSKSAEKTKSIHDIMYKQITSMVSKLVSFKNIEKVFNLSDQMANTTAQIANVNDGMRTTEELQSRIFRSAQATSTSYLATANAVTKLAKNSGSAFGNTEEVVQFNELLNKQFVIDGAGTSEAQASTNALTEALRSGNLSSEQFNTVLKNTPGLINTIADYYGLSANQISSMATNGQISAEAIKSAMFNSADTINSKFEQMPLTWSQLWVVFSNTILQAVTPLLEVIANGAGFIYENWSNIEPIFWGLVAAIGMYTAVTWLASAANRALASSLFSNPIGWIALAIGVVVGLIYKWIQSVGGIDVAWKMVMNTILTAWDWIRIAFQVGVNFVINQFNNLMYSIYSISVGIANYIGDMRVNVLTILQNMVNLGIRLINGFISAINSVTGSNIEVIGELTFATTEDLENQAEKARRNAALQDYKLEIDRAKITRDLELNIMIDSALQATADRTAEINAIRNNKSTQQDIDTAIQYDHVSLSSMSESAGATANNTARMANSLDSTEEDLQYLRDIAHQEAINRYTTAEIKVDMKNDNHISSYMDIDGIVDRFGERMEEVAAAVAEGA